MKNFDEQDIRKAVVAGRFYPGEAKALELEVRRCLMRSGKFAGSCAGRSVLGMMLPHAGYIFSGEITGITMGQVALPERLILLCPSHTGQGSRLAVWARGAWATPLGNALVDEDLAAQLLADPEGGFVADREAHLADHALEVLVPFIQVLRTDSTILPISVRVYEADSLERAGKALARVVRSSLEQGRSACLIASSDMSHYLSSDECMRQDAMALEKIIALDPEGLLRTVLDNRISMCGVAPTAMMLYACKELGAEECCITAHTNSGVTGKPYGADSGRVVGYAGALIPTPAGIAS